MILVRTFLPVWLIAALLPTAASAAAAPAARVSFPAYADVRNLDDYASPAEYDAAVDDRRFVMEQLTYRSDGLDVHAYLYRPAAPSGPLPVIVFNRGSYTWPSFAAELVTMANRLARRGYLVVAPMYRGSGGAAGRDEMGGADLNDLFNLLPVLAGLPYADTGRLHLYGESRGGMMVYQALRDAFPARSAVVVGAFSDLELMLQVPRWRDASAAIWPDLATRRDAIVERRSAVRWADRINVPVLILHGARDRAVDPRHALDMAGRLAGLGRPFELRIVEGQGHTLSGRAAERDGWAMDWFQSHQAPAAAAGEAALPQSRSSR